MTKEAVCSSKTVVTTTRLYGIIYLFIYNLTTLTIVYVASNGRIVREQRIGKDEFCPYFYNSGICLQVLTEITNTPARLSGFRAEI
jgi:hypothetical protein